MRQQLGIPKNITHTKGTMDGASRHTYQACLSNIHGNMTHTECPWEEQVGMKWLCLSNIQKCPYIFSKKKKKNICALIVVDG